MAAKPPRKMNVLSVIIDVLIDLALIGVGFVILYAYNYLLANPLDPEAATPLIANLPSFVVYLAAGLPILIGLLSLVRLVVRIVKGMAETTKKTE